MTNSGAPSAHIEIILPEYASELLASPAKNRKLDRKRVEQYVGIIKRGEWKLTGESIIVDCTGQLVDGQHRLTACAESHIPIVSVVVRGVSADAIDSIDMGRSRSLANILQMQGEGYATPLAGALNHLHSYNTGHTFHQTNPPQTAQQALHLLELNPGLRLSVPKAESATSRVSGGGALFGALHYITSQIDASDADFFIDQYSSGAGLLEGDPVHQFREKMLLNRTRQSSKLTTVEIAALYIKAWNLFRSGEKVRYLRWTPGGGRPEQFPEPV